MGSREVAVSTKPATSDGSHRGLLEAGWHILADGTFTLILTHPAHVKNVPGRKTGVADALWLARSAGARTDPGQLVPEPAPSQAMRGLLRARKQLVREQASHIQRVQKVLDEANIKLASILTDMGMGLSGPGGSQGADRGRD